MSRCEHKTNKPAVCRQREGKKLEKRNIIITNMMEKRKQHLLFHHQSKTVSWYAHFRALWHFRPKIYGGWIKCMFIQFIRFVGEEICRQNVWQNTNSNWALNRRNLQSDKLSFWPKEKKNKFLFIFMCWLTAMSIFCLTTFYSWMHNLIVRHL